MSEWLSDIGNWLDLVLNTVEVIAVVISIITFLYFMFNKFSVGLRRILGPLGLGPWNRIKALFICRKSQNKKRVFIEYAIVKTAGIPTVGKEWKYIISSFKSFYSEDNDNQVLAIKNCFPLTDTAFSNAVKRYLDYFNLPKVKRAFGIEGDLTFIMQIKIEEAYLMPTCLLNGLLASFDENWEEFIKQYISTAYSEDEEHVHKILSNELFYTFNWLLWGPSYELDYQNGLWGGLCQITYGDESYSMPAVADTSKVSVSGETAASVADMLRVKFLEKDNSQNGRYGFLASATIRIVDEVPFYKSIEKEINPHNAYFYEKIKGDALFFGVKIENFTPITNYRTHKYYATAYVWTLFIEESDEKELFRPEKCVAFYEHANIADKKTYEFLVDSMINKSLFHFKTIYDGKVYQERKYRFLLGMNDRISERIKKTYELEMKKGDGFAKWLKEHISFEPKFTSNTVFQGFDDYFKPNQDFTFVEVDPKNKKDLADLGEFYTDIYIDIFKDKDERETFDNLLEYLRLNEENGGKDYTYHILLMKDSNGMVLGGCVFDYFRKTNSAAIEFIAVKEVKQSVGYGTTLYKEVLKVLNNDALKNKERIVNNIIIELNRPDINEEGDPLKYLYFWNKFSYRHLEFQYVQPPLEEDKKEVRCLWLGYASPKYIEEHQGIKYQEEVKKEDVMNTLEQFFKYAFRIENPRECPQFKETEASVKGEYIKTSPIIEK